MTDNVSMEQEREWNLLYEQIREMLRQVGDEEKNYCLLDCNMGLYRQRVETERLEFVQPAVIKSLQELLIGFPNWEIAIVVGNGGGVVIRDDEIIDGLQRQHLPKEFQTIEYEGSRPLGSQFGDIMYSGLSIAVAPGPFGIHLPQDANIQLPKDDDPTT
jgi:hypothetical protein